MSNIVLRSLLQTTARAQLRALSTSSVRCSGIVADLRTKDGRYPRIGDRDIVGSGPGGDPFYVDQEDFPCPAIRFGKNTPEIMALREKEKGDWKSLTLEEKKRLYRHSFRQTFAEVYAPTGEWKSSLTIVIATITATLFGVLWLHYFVYPPPQKTLTEEWRRGMLKRMVKQNQGFIEGVSSRYDYEKGDWKK